MPKHTYKHQTEDGTVHTRKTDRTYSHVLIADMDQETSVNNHVAGPGPVVLSWIGRPDLVPAALKSGGYGLGRNRRVEAINGGVRP
jgi:hypothetical protein